jgi:hypothetical protein
LRQRARHVVAVGVVHRRDDRYPGQRHQSGRTGRDRAQAVTTDRSRADSHIVMVPDLHASVHMLPKTRNR